MQNSFSEISLNSKLEKPSSLKSKQVSTTNNDSKVSHQDSVQSFSSNTCNQTQNSQTTKIVQKKILQIEVAQSQLSEKYQKVINNLILEINKKDEANVLLQKEIVELSQQLQESKKDLGIIVSYLKKKQRKDNPNTSNKIGLNSTKASDKIDKSVPGSTKNLEPSNKIIQNTYKNKSPRQLLGKQSLKW